MDHGADGHALLDRTLAVLVKVLIPEAASFVIIEAWIFFLNDIIVLNTINCCGEVVEILLLFLSTELGESENIEEINIEITVPFELSDKVLYLSGN